MIGRARSRCRDLELSVQRWNWSRLLLLDSGLSWTVCLHSTTLYWMNWGASACPVWTCVTTPETGPWAVLVSNSGWREKPRVRIGLESVRFQSSSALPDLIVSAAAVTAAMQRLLHGFVFRHHGFSYACHGLIEETKAVDYLRTFLGDSVAIKGFGDRLGAGLALYYGDAPPILSSTVTLDMSRVLEDGLYVRVFMTIDGRVDTPARVQALADQRIQAALAAVRLEMS